MILRVVMALCLMLAGCASSDPAARLSPEERTALREYHYPGNDPFATTPGHHRALKGDPAAIHAFLERSTDPELDGAEGAIYSRNLLYLLFVLGDERFAKALSTYPPPVKSAVRSSLQTLWSRSDLSYPRTEASLLSRGI